MPWKIGQFPSSLFPRDMDQNQHNITWDQKGSKSYKRSRAGQRIFHYIHAIVSSDHDTWTTTYIVENRNNTQINLVSHASHTKQTSAVQSCIAGQQLTKPSGIKVHITEQKLDMYALTETWIKEDDTITSLHLCSPNYKALSFPRSNRTGGGIALIYNKWIDVKTGTVYSYKSMECTDFCINHQHKDTKFAVIYRPLDTSIIGFITDLIDYIERNINDCSSTVLPQWL